MRCLTFVSLLEISKTKSTMIDKTDLLKTVLAISVLNYCHSYNCITT